MSLCLFFPQTTADPLVYNLKSFSLSRNARFPHRGLLNCQFHSGLCRNETSGLGLFILRFTSLKEDILDWIPSQSCCLKYVLWGME
jgi:hypothetical protein